MPESAAMEGYRECHLCTVQEKMRARQCYYCTGRLDLKDLLLLESEKRWRKRFAPVLSAFMPGFGHWFSGRRYIGTYFFAMAPLSIGLVLATYQKWNWGLTVLTLTFLLVWLLAILDTKRGPANFVAPCQTACPAGVSCSHYVHMAAMGMDLEAVELVEKVCPFPGTIGRICPHPCEQDCNRGKDGEPVAVCALKRFVKDHAVGSEDMYSRELEKNRKSLGQRIAVIGAGPSGLTAALYLSIFGFDVTIFEAKDFGGGSPAIYMPGFRLPADLYRKEVDRILGLGFDLRLGQKLGEDFTLRDIQDQGFSAVFLAMGAMKSIKLPHTGDESEGFLDGKEFLARVRSGEGMSLSGDVLIIGGGNVAMDVARCAVRSGADNVRVVCLEKKPEPGERNFRYSGNEWREIKQAVSAQYMPAFPWEIRGALKEGVEIFDGLATETFDMKDGRVRAASCLKVERIKQDQDGRVTPILEDGAVKKLRADWVLTAVGSTPDYSVFDNHPPESIPVSREAAVVLLKNGTGLTIPVVSGGDMASGPATVVEALAAGKEAALYIYRKLAGTPPVSIRYRSRRTLVPWANYSDSLDSRRRRREIVLPLEERRTSFEEVYRGFAEKTAREEAERCMRCDWPLVRESKVRKFFRRMEKESDRKIS